MREKNRKSFQSIYFAAMQALSSLRRLAIFGGVGVIGFAVDAIILFVAIKFAGAGPITGRFFSIFAAMMTTWYLNRTFTFSIESRNYFAEIARYAFAKSVGLAANLSIYMAIVLLAPVNSYPLFALVTASGASLLINFTLLKHFVFQDERVKR